MPEQPRHKHDCSACTFLGQHGEYDLYHCLQFGKYPTVIARFSSYGPDYSSGINSGIPELQEAQRRAVERGLKVKD